MSVPGIASQKVRDAEFLELHHRLVSKDAEQGTTLHSTSPRAWTAAVALVLVFSEGILEI
jgi:hypothetical protein